MENLNVLEIGELRQLETLVAALLRDEPLIAGLSLLEKQAIEETVAIVQSLLAAQLARTNTFAMPNQESQPGK